MNEHSFIRSIHRKLPRDLYVWKILDQFAGGVADAYYSGPVADLWVEYKYLKLPTRPTSKLPKNLGLTDQQLFWLSSRRAEGRAVWVVVGSDSGGCVLLTDPLESGSFSSRDTFDNRKVGLDSVIEHIISHTCGR